MLLHQMCPRTLVTKTQLYQYMPKVLASTYKGWHIYPQLLLPLQNRALPVVFCTYRFIFPIQMSLSFSLPSWLLHSRENEVSRCWSVKNPLSSLTSSRLAPSPLFIRSPLLRELWQWSVTIEPQPALLDFSYSAAPMDLTPSLTKRAWFWLTLEHFYQNFNYSFAHINLLWSKL